MIYFFSATGNSEYIAKKISYLTGDKKLKCINKDLKKNLRRQYIRDNESVGFILPVHYLNIPKIVQIYLNELTFLNYTTQYFYVILTHSNFCGSADKIITEFFLNKNIIINSIFKVRMPSNYILGNSSAPHEIELNYILSKAEPKIKSIAETIKTHINNNEVDSDYITEPISKMFNNIMLYSQSSAKKFYANDNCGACGLCERICPDGCICISERKPVWQFRRCSKCLACINRCPKKAIQYGTETLNKARYYNPKLKHIQQS